MKIKIGENMSDNEAKEKLVDLVVENVKDKRLRNELLYYIFNGHTSPQQHLTSRI